MRNKQFVQIGIGYYPECINLAKEGESMWGLPSDIDWTGVVVDFQPLALQSAMIAIEENRLLDKVTVINAAVSRSSDIREVKFKHISDEIDAHSSLADAKTDRDATLDCGQFDYSMYCSAVSLNDLVNKVMRLKYVEIGLLALDVQGSEADILRYYDWIHEPDYIMIETHSSELGGRVQEILEMRYRVVRDLSCEHDKKVGRPNILWEKT